jgi:outer membrane receptor protein involved in Fe transport
MGNRKSRLTVRSAVTLLFAALGFTQGAPAAELEEVVVTAQKVTENIQVVPIAITAFTSSEIQTKGLTDLTKLSALTPNVNMDGGSPFSGDSSVLSASIRGIGQDDFAFNLDPGVGVYLDGVYLARTIGANQSLLDVERIEIAKGPQGTLAGRNTIGGAVNIVTHTPGNEFKIAGQATLGNYERRDVQVMVDVPLTDNILSTVSVSSQTREGWTDIVPYPSNSSIGMNPFKVMGQSDMPKAPGTEGSAHDGGKDVQAMRGKILFNVSDAVDVTVGGDYTHQDQSGLPNTIMGVFGTNQDTYLNPNSPEAGLLFAGPLMGNFYNMCITTPAAALAAGLFNSTNGLCGPLGVGTWNSATNSFRGNGFTGGVPALAGNGAVGVPNAVLQNLVADLGGVAQPNGTFALPGGGVVTLGAAGDPHGGSVIYPGQTPRLYWTFNNTQTGSKDETFANGPSFARYDNWGASITIDWIINDDMTLKSITGYRGIDWKVGTDLDGIPESIQEVTDHQEQEQWSQEFQLTGKAFDDRLSYVLGLYYFTEEGFVHDFVPFDTAYLWIFDYTNDVNTDSYAGYMNLNYRVMDNLGITFGFRYSDENKDFEGGQGDLNGFSYKISGCLDPAADASTFFPFLPPGLLTCQQLLGFPDPTNPLRYFPAGKDSQSWTDFSPTAGLQYHFTDDIMGYFSYSEGFKSGGWTTRLSQPIQDADQATFDPEHNTAYEVGVKSQWFDNRLRMNIAGFYNDYEGIQINVQQGPSPVYQNAGDADIWGFEVEMQSVFANGFGLDAAVGYMDAEYTDLEDCLLYNAVDPDGPGGPAPPVCAPENGSSLDPNFGGFTDNTELPKTPEWKFTISPSYEMALGNGSTLLFLLDFTHTSHLQNTAPNTPLLERESVDMLNMSAHWTPESGRYVFSAGVSNLLDERYLTVGSTNPAAGEIVGSYNAPLMWYGSVRVNFD